MSHQRPSAFRNRWLIGSPKKGGLPRLTPVARQVRLINSCCSARLRSVISTKVMTTPAATFCDVRYGRMRMTQSRERSFGARSLEHLTVSQHPLHVRLERRIVDISDDLRERTTAIAVLYREQLRERRREVPDAAAHRRGRRWQSACCRAGSACRH